MRNSQFFICDLLFAPPASLREALRAGICYFIRGLAENDDPSFQSC